MAAWTAFLLAFSALLPMINPLGSALVFLGLVGKAPPALYRTLARRITVNNILFLGAFELAGSAILKFFGISLPIVEVAGGIVIAGMAWGVLNEDDSDAGVQKKQEEADELGRLQILRSQSEAVLPFYVSHYLRSRNIGDDADAQRPLVGPDTYRKSPRTFREYLAR